MTRTRTNGWIVGSHHSKATKRRISRTMKGARNVGVGFLRRVNCPRCQQEMSIANIGKHEPACSSRAQLSHLFSTAMSVRAMKSFRRTLEALGATVEQYVAMYAAQKGVCAICRKSCSSRKRLSVDHCHDTGVIRGLLCSKCNMGIGMFGNNPALMRSAAAYLSEAEKQ